MSRVTKLQKHFRRLSNDKHNKWTRGYKKSRSIRRAQGGKLYDWETGHRTPIRGTWNVVACSCGHKRHGRYGCERGCAWGECSADAFARPVEPISWQPLALGDMDHEFEAISRARAALILGVFQMPTRTLRTLDDGTKILIVGDTHIGDLVAGELDKRF